MPIPSAATRRSTILVPAHSDRMLAKARGFAADLALLDLEDSAPDTDAAKQMARSNAVGALRGGGFAARALSVRVNGPRTRWFDQDIAAILAAGSASISLPHTYGAADVLAAEAAIRAAAGGRNVEVLLAVETPATVLDLEEIARRSSMIAALYVAPNDYTLEVGSPALIGGDAGVADDAQLAWLRHKVVAVARAKGWQPIDAVTAADPRDEQAVRSAMRRSRNLGFAGCAVMYPAHVDIANEVFAPSATELAWADDVIARFEALTGDRAATASDGRVALRQHYEFARQLRALSEAIEGKS
jgi:citrate lyase subunit beta/citryl-CoA lyase